jgi:ABC-type multidrug transport system fused ATPase/permease subunit
MNTQKMQPIIGDLAGAVELIDCLGFIEFDSVQSGTLNSLTFHCEENTVTAILGLSISEKITLWQLLFRLIDPSDGRILIDGRNVQGYMIKSLRRHIAIIHQSCELRDGTIRQNIKYGLSNPDSITDSMLEHVCRRVNIHSTIMKLPGGYSYQASRRETSLDGEKIRRLALVMLLLQTPKIICIDQRLLQLEEESEEQLQEVIKAVSHLRTIIVVE